MVEQLRPTLDQAGVNAALETLLDAAHAHLHQAPELRCRGIFLDTLSAADQRTAEELLAELQQLLQGTGRDDLAPEMVSGIARRVEAITRRFAEISGAYRRIGVYLHRLRDMGMHRTLDLLAAPEQESLALALFLIEQLDSISANDYSAPAIHISSVVELEVQRRIARCPDLVGDAANPKKQTLGLLPFMRRFPERTEGDWERITAFVATRWNEHIDRDEPEQVTTFDAFVRAIDTIGQLRNKAAHPHPVSRDDYSTLFRITCQAGALRLGTLNALLLAWKAT